MASEGIDWDEALLRSVNDIKTAPDNISFNKYLLAMIKKAGKMKTDSSELPEVPDSLNQNDFSWIGDPVFSDPVKSELEEIKNKFRPHRNRYVQRAQAGNPVFNRDTAYFSGNIYPDEGKRILALFRYWNIIEYFYPYKRIMDQDWDVTLKNFIPVIVDAPDELSYQQAFREFITHINDSHGYFYVPDENGMHAPAFPPFNVRQIQNEMVITGVIPEIKEIAKGDIIKKIDGIDIYYLKDSLRRYTHGSNAVAVERNLNANIIRGKEGPFTVTVLNDKGGKTVTLERKYSNYKVLRNDSTVVWRKVQGRGGCQFGIVDMGRLEVSQVKKMFYDLWNTDAIIFDIRNYPRGTLWTIVNYLFKSPLYVANFTIPDITYPGRLSWGKAVIGNGTKTPYAGSIIILFDERTQSQAEYTCMGLEQFPRSLKIGSTTAAADGNVSKIFLPGQITTMATFLGTYYPDYTSTQRVGIIPDIKVTPTIRGIRDGKDEVLDAALNCELQDKNH